MKGWRTAWRSLTQAAALKGLRFHDLRHQAITELCEMGLSDMTIMGIAGHVSRDILEHYSHIRLDAKRKALDGLQTVPMHSPFSLPLAESQKPN
jgi:integrase